MNSAAKHRRSGTKQRNPRQLPILPNLTEFLESRGLQKHGKQPLNFRSQKNIDAKRAA
jgi:hypothetical protein